MLGTGDDDERLVAGLPHDLSGHAMTDARRYLLIVALIAVVIVLSSPFWEAYPRASTAAVVILSFVVYEGVWWGHVHKPRDEYHDDGRMEP